MPQPLPRSAIASWFGLHAWLAVSGKEPFRLSCEAPLRPVNAPSTYWRTTICAKLCEAFVACAHCADFVQRAFSVCSRKWMLWEFLCFLAAFLTVLCVSWILLSLCFLHHIEDFPQCPFLVQHAFLRENTTKIIGQTCKIHCHQRVPNLFWLFYCFFGPSPAWYRARHFPLPEFPI